MTVGVTFLHEIHCNWKLDKSLYFMKQAAGHLILLQSTIAIILTIIRIQEVWWLIVDCILCCCGPTATTIWTVVGCCWALSRADLPWKFLPHQHVLCVVAAVVPPCTAPPSRRFLCAFFARPLDKAARGGEQIKVVEHAVKWHPPQHRIPHQHRRCYFLVHSHHQDCLWNYIGKAKTTDQMKRQPPHRAIMS